MDDDPPCSRSTYLQQLIMVTERQHPSLTRLHQAHLLSLRARMLLKEKELQILDLIDQGKYAAAVEEKNAYQEAAKLLLESLYVLKKEFVDLPEQEREQEIGSALLRIFLEFENIEQTLIF